VEQFNNADDLLEKVVALKAIGNAALDSVPQELVDYIKTASPKSRQREAIRTNAMEALRRIPSQKVEQLLAPVYLNQEEQPMVGGKHHHVLISLFPLPSTDSHHCPVRPCPIPAESVGAHPRPNRLPDDPGKVPPSALLFALDPAGDGQFAGEKTSENASANCHSYKSANQHSIRHSTFQCPAHQNGSQLGRSGRECAEGKVH
jgi:hypothetical protein